MERETPEGASERPAYQPPRITAMDQKEVLAAFQITSAAPTWWA